MRNTICAALTAITLALCVALAGCGSSTKASTPGACGQTHRLAMHRRRHHPRLLRMRHHIAGHAKSGLCRLRMGEARRPVLRLEPCERRGQGAGKMSYNVVTTEGIRTFENIDDAGDYAQAMSLRTGEPAKVFHAETGLVAFTVRPTTKDTK